MKPKTIILVTVCAFLASAVVVRMAARTHKTLFDANGNSVRVLGQEAAHKTGR